MCLAGLIHLAFGGHTQSVRRWFLEQMGHLTGRFWVGQACRGHLPALTPPAALQGAPTQNRGPASLARPLLSVSAFSFATPPQEPPCGGDKLPLRGSWGGSETALTPCGRGREEEPSYLVHVAQPGWAAGMGAQGALALLEPRDLPEGQSGT